jgi:hypothetical protein
MIAKYGKIKAKGHDRSRKMSYRERGSKSFSEGGGG